MDMKSWTWNHVGDPHNFCIVFRRPTSQIANFPMSTARMKYKRITFCERP